MDTQHPPSRRRLPGRGEPPTGAARARSRDDGQRLVRRLSNWAAVTLVAATAVTAGYFARAHPAAGQYAAVTGSQSQAAHPSSGAPCVTAPVAVSGGSGVTTTVPTRTCAPGTGGGTSPAVVYVTRGEGDRGD